MVKVAPSLLSCDFSRLAEELDAIEKAGADWAHLDVMDGHFVPNLTFGAPIIKKIRPHSSLFFDTHLMISKPHLYIEDFASAGADLITIHVECESDIEKTLKDIRHLGKQSGLSLRPGTSVEKLRPFLEWVDLVLVMTVEPGFGGQSFLSDQVEKISYLKQIQKETSSFLIEVDGGVNEETASLCSEADVLVAGSYVFKGNYQERIQNLKVAHKK